jgi:VCBS repeat-containing protein
VAVGAFPVTVTLADDSPGIGSAIAQTTATVVATPTVVADRAGVNVGASVTADAAHGVLANDIDPIAGDTLHVAAVNGQAGNVGHTIAGTFGSLTLKADGSYTYAASSSAVLPASGVGQDVFTYTASTGPGGTADSTLTVTVTATGFTYLGGTPGTTITAPQAATLLSSTAGPEMTRSWRPAEPRC